MFSSRIGLIRRLGLILLAALILSAVEGCARTAPTVAPTTFPMLTTPTTLATMAPTATSLTDPTITTLPTAVSTSAPSPEADYPLALNNTWVYESTRYEGFNPQQIMTATQTITETVVEVKSGPSYFAARMDRETSADVPVIVPQDMESLLRPAESSEYWLVVQDNRIYRQEGEPDLSNLADTDSLEFVLPLKPGARWILYPPRLPADNAQSTGLPRQALRTGTVQVPAGRFDDCLLFRDDWVDSTVENWFCPGVGWVDLKSDHNGTPYGSRQVLLSYHLSTPTPAGTASPTPDSKASLAARTTLERFMQARIDGDEPAELNLLTDRLRSQVMKGLPVDVPLTQASNPCWYRYQILTYSQPNLTQAQARVRVYEHQWPGDNAGSLPRSWEQEIGLVETSAGWRVDELGGSENERQEPDEPHGPSLSACIASSSTPAYMEPASTPMPLLRSSEFLTLNEAQKASAFSLLLPKFIPDSLPFYKAWVFDYTDGTETVRILYTFPGDQLDANKKAVDVELTRTDAPVTLDSVTHQFRQTALDVREVQVRGQIGYSYWSPAAAQGNSAVLVWREGGLKIQITLFGDWPQPTERNPHGLDGLLLNIADSLSTVARSNP